MDFVVKRLELFSEGKIMDIIFYWLLDHYMILVFTWLAAVAVILSLLRGKKSGDEWSVRNAKDLL